MAIEVDALVAGAGPAGSVSALLLARAGWRVVLADGGPSDRLKTCGHCLGARVLSLLDTLGLRDPVESITTDRTSHVRIWMSGRPVLESRLATGTGDHVAHAGTGRVVDRRRLDPLLRALACGAGAALWSPAHVQAPELERDGCRVRVRRDDREVAVSARLLVIADGIGSGLVRALHWSRPRPRARCCGVSFDLPAEAVPAESLTAGTISMHLGRCGYLGQVRQRNHVHVAALVRGGHPLESAMDEFRAELPWLPGSMRQAEGFVATGPLPWAAERVAAPGVAVVGDAAGSPEPLTGEGMSWAIESAAFLAASINADSTPGFDARAAARYTAAWNAHIHAGLRRCALLSRALEHPRVLGACSRLASRIPRLPEFIVRTVVPA